MCNPLSMKNCLRSFFLSWGDGHQTLSRSLDDLTISPACFNYSPDNRRRVGGERHKKEREGEMTLNESFAMANNKTRRR